MKVTLIFIKVILIIVFSTIIACIFGVVHNQISFTVSNEFFEDFLFGNFGVNQWGIESKRTQASIVGILGTYWLGLILGTVYAIIFLFLKTSNNFKHTIKAILINLGIAAIGSFICYLIALFFPLEKSPVFIDFGTQNPKNYLEAAFMHEGSYIGGMIGLIVGILFLLKMNRHNTTEVFEW